MKATSTPPDAISGRRIRVLFVRPTLAQGGADKVTLTVLRNLDRARFEPHLALLRAEGVWLEQVPKDVTVHALGVDRVRRMGPALLRRIREVRPDVVFSTASGTNSVAVVAAKLAGCPVVVSERNVVFNGGVRPASVVQWALKTGLYRWADGITAVNHGVARDVHRKLLLPARRVRALLNPTVGPDLAAKAGEPVDHPWLQAGNRTVLAAGRLVPTKEHATLLRAFARVRVEVPESHLVILGEGPEKERLVALAQDLGLADAVAFAGFQTNPYAYMARAAAYALSSSNEGLPNSLIEAMACGCPVVSTDCPPGMAEVVTDGTDGLLVPVGDVPGIAAALVRLLRDRDLATRLGAQAQRSAERYRVEAVIGNYEQAILDALDRRGAPRA